MKAAHSRKSATRWIRRSPHVDPHRGRVLTRRTRSGAALASRVFEPVTGYLGTGGTPGVSARGISVSWRDRLDLGSAGRRGPGGDKRSSAAGADRGRDRGCDLGNRYVPRRLAPRSAVHTRTGTRDREPDAGEPKRDE